MQGYLKIMQVFFQPLQDFFGDFVLELREASVIFSGLLQGLVGNFAQFSWGFYKASVGLLLAFLVVLEDFRKDNVGFLGDIADFT